MTSNSVLASYGFMQGWLYAVLVQEHDIDYPLKLKKYSISKDDKIGLIRTQCGVTWSFCLAVFELSQYGKLRNNFTYPYKNRSNSVNLSPFFPTMDVESAGLKSRAFLNPHCCCYCLGIKTR